MKTHSFILAIAASLATSALATAAAADDTLITLADRYSSEQLQSICARDDGQWYRMARGTYGCIAGGNVVECSNAGICSGFSKAPLALTGAGAGNHREIGAEAVLQMPAPPKTEELTSGSTGLTIAPQ